MDVYFLWEMRNRLNPRRTWENSNKFPPSGVFNYPRQFMSSYYWREDTLYYSQEEFRRPVSRVFYSGTSVIEELRRTLLINWRRENTGISTYVPVSLLILLKFVVFSTFQYYSTSISVPNLPRELSAHSSNSRDTLYQKEKNQYFCFLSSIVCAYLYPY